MSTLTDYRSRMCGVPAARKIVTVTSNSLKRAARALMADTGMTYTAALAQVRRNVTPLITEDGHRPAPFDPTRNAVFSGYHGAGKTVWASEIRRHNHMLGRPQIRLVDSAFLGLDRHNSMLFGEPVIAIHDLPDGWLDPLQHDLDDVVAVRLSMEIIASVSNDPTTRRYVAESLPLHRAATTMDLARYLADHAGPLLAAAARDFIYLAEFDPALLRVITPRRTDTFSLPVPSTLLNSHAGSSDAGSLQRRISNALQLPLVALASRSLGLDGNLTIDQLNAGDEDKHLFDVLRVILHEGPAPYVLEADADSSLDRATYPDADRYDLSLYSGLPSIEGLRGDRRYASPSLEPRETSMMPLREDGRVVRGSVAQRNGEEYLMLAHQPSPHHDEHTSIYTPRELMRDREALVNTSSFHRPDMTNHEKTTDAGYVPDRARQGLFQNLPTEWQPTTPTTLDPEVKANLARHLSDGH